MLKLVDTTIPMKINFAVWRARITLLAGYLFALAAALEHGVAGIPPLLPLLPENVRHDVAAAIAILLTLQAVQTRVQKPSVVPLPPGEPGAEPDNHAQK